MIMHFFLIFLKVKTDLFKWEVVAKYFVFVVVYFWTQCEDVEAFLYSTKLCLVGFVSCPCGSSIVVLYIIYHYCIYYK